MQKGFITPAVALIVATLFIGVPLAAWYTAEPEPQVAEEVAVGGFGDTFLSLQVGTDPTNGDCLTTDGTNSTWSATCGSSSGAATLDGLNDVTITSSSTGNILYLAGSGQWVNLATGSDGQVLKLASGIPSWDTDNTAAGGSGLGTTTPWTAGQLAVVATDGDVKSVATSTLSENISGLEFDANPWIVGSARTLSLSSGYVIPLTASTTEWHNKVSSQWGTSGSNIYYSAGNVGIGTTTPTERLAVTGEGSGVVLMGETGFGSGYSGLSFNGGLGVTTYNLLGGVTQNHLWINRKTGGDIYFRENNVDQVVIKGTTGNVGIGTASPSASAKLHIDGSNALIYTEPSADDGQWNGLNTLNSSGAVIGGFTANTQSGEVAVGSRNASYFTTIYGGSAERMRITSAGNVGIGTTTPGQRLHVVGGNIGIDDNRAIYWGSDGWYSIQNNRTSNNLSLGANNAQMVLNAITGNVGIGSSTPSSKLTVQGNTWIGGNVTATGTLAVTGSTTISSLATANCDVFATALGSLYCGTNGAGGGTVTSVDMSVPTGLSISGNPVTTSGTLALTLTSGYVIPLSASTTEWTNFYNTPSTRITDGTGLTWSGNTLNVDDAYVLNTGDSISGNLTFSGTGANIALGSNYLSGDGGDEGIYVDSSGNVGIGTTTPAARLQVTGVAGTNPFRVASSSNTSLFEITQLGRVGIGSSSPSHTLTVAGDLNVTGASRISIPRSFTWPGVATTTSATSTIPLGIAMSAEAWNSARCKTTSGTAAWLFKDDAGNRMNGGTASTTSTSTLVTLSTNNTFTTGEGRNVDIGPLTNAIITCSVDVTINN